MLSNRILIDNKIINGCNLSVYYDLQDAYYKLDDVKKEYKTKNYETYGF